MSSAPTNNDAGSPAADRVGRSPRRAKPEVRGLLAGMRIRKKLIVLHTGFSLVLAGILWLALQPAVAQVVLRAEEHESRLALAALFAAMNSGVEQPPMREFVERLGPDVAVRWGTAEQLGIPPELAAAAVEGEAVVYQGADGRGAAALRVPDALGFVSASVRQDTARAAVVRLYVLMTVALLAVYGLVAAALEVFVLPRHVYEPIRAILAADRAVAEGRTEEELVPEHAVPADELGEIMRSRNGSIAALRRNERELADALGRLEEVATDLKRKNHLLEMARQNLADADRLASLGMMSAGVAHELNTPLAVLKGLVEKLNASGRAEGAPPSVSASEAALMLKVLGRLERLSESLLDFARVRPPSSRSTPLRPLVDDAWTLVLLDRAAADVRMQNDLGGELAAWCDGDRLVQVLVNLLRNAVDALESTTDPLIVVSASESVRDGRRWVSVAISDNGPGIDAAVLPRLFQPFASTRLDSRGTGLGLAVSEGIVREHGGVLLARNRTDGRGAVFEIMLPAEPE